MKNKLNAGESFFLAKSDLPFEWNLFKCKDKQGKLSVYCVREFNACLCREGEKRGAARLSRPLHHRMNSDSAVSGNIHLHAERLIGMPHSILHAFNTFQFCAVQTWCDTSQHPHHTLMPPPPRKKTWTQNPQFNFLNKEVNSKLKCIAGGFFFEKKTNNTLIKPTW